MKTKILILGLLLGLLAAQATLGATFTVTTTNDTGAGSLRQAITDANATDGVDTIQFGITDPPAGVPHHYARLAVAVHYHAGDS